MDTRLARLLVSLGAGLALVTVVAALLIHRLLFSEAAERGRGLEQELRAELRAPGPEDVVGGRQPGVDALDLALARQPVVVQIGAETIYEPPELGVFDTAQVLGAIGTTPDSHQLLPPSRVEVAYGRGAVDVAWEPGPANRLLARTLDNGSDDLSLAFRVYRGVDLAPPELLATVPFGKALHTDRQLPLAASRLDYEIWTVLLREGPSGEVLVGAERSEKVTVESPDHFTLRLVGGSPEQAVFEVDVELPVAAGTVRILARPGDELVVSGRPAGLVLMSIEQIVEDKLTTQRRLLLTTDGSLVLDPTTHEPRTTETQVLVPVTRLFASLTNRDGVSRLLDVDLP